MTGLLRGEGFHINPKRTYGLCRENGLLCTPRGRKTKKRCGSVSNACHIRKASKANEVWAVDFVSDRTCDGKSLKMLTVLDEFTREALAIEVERSMGAAGVRKVLSRLFIKRGAPAFVRSDNGGEFSGRVLEDAMREVGGEVALIAPGSPWQNGKNERFNGILVEEVLSREVWGNLLEAQVVCEAWRKTYNQVRPHGSLGMMTPSAYAQNQLESGGWFQHSHLAD
jgi:transposase InsO family protein